MRQLVIFLLFVFPFAGFAQKEFPDPPDIDSVSVVSSDNEVFYTILGWEPYDWTGYNPDSSGFIIRRVVPVTDSTEGYATIDTIYDGYATFYVDSSSDPAQQIHPYGLDALTIVDGDTLLSEIADQFSRNMRLQINNYDTCKRSVKLTWNTYYRKDEIPWAPNDPPYNIYAESENDSRHAVSDTNVYTFSGLNINETYSFKVRIFGSGLSSTSNPVSIQTQAPDSTSQPYFLSLTTTSNFSNEISTHIDKQNTGQLLILRSSTLNGTYDTIQRLDDFSGSIVNYTDNRTSKEIAYYSIVAKDACLSIPKQSDTLNTIILKAQLYEKFVDLDANEEIGYDSIYVLHRKANGNWETFIVSPPVEYNDFGIMDITLENPIVTYFFEINKDSAIIRSNPVSVTIQDDLLWPNAIIAGRYGVDGKFRAFVQRSVPEAFKMKIYNKWGELVFESNDIEESWDGTYGGSVVPPGAYLYVATYNFKGQSPENVKGTVTVIH